MTSLIGHELASPARAAADSCVGDQPRYRPFYCAVALFAADGLAAVSATLPVLWCRQIFQQAGWRFAQPAPMSRLHDIAVLLGVMFVYFAMKGRYSKRLPFWSEGRLVVKAALGAIMLEILFGILSGDLAVRLPIMAVFLLLPAFGVAANRLAKHALQHASVWTVPVVIVGGGQGAEDAEAALRSDSSLGYRVIGRIDPAAILSAPGGQHFRPLLERFAGCRLLIAVDGEGPAQRRLVECALRERVPFALMPSTRAFPSFSCEVSQFLSHDMRIVAFRDDLSHPLPLIVKGTMDLCVAALLLFLAAPIFLAIFLANWSRGGPVFFAHRRIGAGGRSFGCLKFRTMVVDSDRVLQEALASDPALAAEWAASRKLARDPRVTPFGRFLRKTSLDELPQLINVLRRDMSLVGPRPIVESEIELYGDSIAQYYATRPGLTGLWQVSGRSRTSYARRVELDVWYVNNWSIWNDFAVLLKTLPVVFRGDGAC